MKIRLLLPLWLSAACRPAATPVPAPPAAVAMPEVSWYQDRAMHEAWGEGYMIASQGQGTSMAAREILEAGGNLVDAAAAASFAVAVERPQSTGIGGGGFMMIRLADPPGAPVQAVDFRERAPLAATATMFQDAAGDVILRASSVGPLASGVPGMVAGVLEIHARHGSLPLAQVMAPAIRLAEEGLVVYPHMAAAMEAMKPVLVRYPASRSAYLVPTCPQAPADCGEDPAGWRGYQVGERLAQPLLAGTLRRIAEQGAPGFYQGPVAEALLAEQARLGGLITAADLDGYEVRWREPVSARWKDYEIFSMPPPSSGGAHVVQILNILEGDDLRALGPYHPRTIHLTAAAMQAAFADRSVWLGDPDQVEVPLAGLLSRDYARALRQQIPEDRARSQAEVGPGDPTAYAPAESEETTHFTLADSRGNVIASTQTVNGWFGSGVVVPGAGFVLNNEMNDFSAKERVPNDFGAVGAERNAVAPGRRPLSSMSPTLVMQDGAPVLALGSPAGTRIISCVTLTILNHLEHGLGLYDAVTALRYHHQWTSPDALQVEHPGFSAETTAALEGMGYPVKVQGIGCKIQAIAMQDGGRRLHGVSDPRGEGLVVSERPLGTWDTSVSRD